jgi:hypothetical protein
MPINTAISGDHLCAKALVQEANTASVTHVGFTYVHVCLKLLSLSLCSTDLKVFYLSLCSTDLKVFYLSLCSTDLKVFYLSLCSTDLKVLSLSVFY